MRSLVRCKQLEYQKRKKLIRFGNTGHIAGYFRSAKSEVSALDYDIVKSDLDHVITLAPDFVYAYYNRANVLAMLKDYRRRLPTMIKLLN